MFAINVSSNSSSNASTGIICSSLDGVLVNPGKHSASVCMEHSPGFNSSTCECFNSSVCNNPCSPLTKQSRAGSKLLPRLRDSELYVTFDEQSVLTSLLTEMLFFAMETFVFLFG